MGFPRGAGDVGLLKTPAAAATPGRAAPQVQALVIVFTDGGIGC
nr:hypothetical protein [uncultured Acetobacteroides sp.]